MSIPIIFSTVTGNAARLAFAAAEVVPEYIGPYNIQYVLGDGTHTIKGVTAEILDKFDTFVIVYWCDLGSADKDTLELVSRLRNKNLLMLGTLGAPADGDHAQKVYERVSAIANENNNLLGHYLCRGSIDLYRTKKKREIPEGQKGHLSEAGYQRHLQSQGHPNLDDLTNAKEAIKIALNLI